MVHDGAGGSAGCLLALLRSAAVRPTMARIWVLEALAAASSDGLEAKELERELHRRGTPLSLSTVHCVIRDLEARGVLVRFRRPPAHSPAMRVRLAAPVSGGDAAPEA